MKKYIVDEFEAQELAAAVLGIEQGETEGDSEYEDQINTELIGRYSCSIDEYTQIIQDLMDKLTVACSPITDNVYIGFSEPGMWLVKKECDNWIQQVLQWLGGSDDMEAGEKIEKKITAGGVVEYKITLEKIAKI